MQGTNHSEDRFTTLMKRYIRSSAIVWTIVVGALMLWDVSQVRKTTQDLALNEAHAHLARDQAFRFWATTHGGFYVPVDDRTPPNPYLAQVPERDIETPSGIPLTLMNPAYALRQMNEDFKELFGVAGHITSLNPLRPENAADDWERAALEAFEGGATEVREFTEIGGTPYLRMMRPMMTAEGCLKCHAHQGYQVGDVRGGVSVSVPLTPYTAKVRQTITAHTLALGALWLLGLSGLGWGWHGLGQRIQERGHAQNALQEETEKKEAVLRSVGDAIAMSDLEGRIQYVNEAYTALTGYTSDEVIGWPIDFTVSESDTVQAMQAQRMNLVKGNISQVETVIRRKDGRTFDTALTIAPMHNAQGQLTGQVTSYRDISRDKALNRARSEFITNISHELRTPVTSLKLYVQLLRKSGQPERTEDYLRILEEQTGRLEELVQDILDITALESSKTTQAWEPISLPILIDGAITRYQNRAQEAGLTFDTMPVPPDLPGVKGDEARLNQALNELLENAIIFTLAGGHVTIEANTVDEDGVTWATVSVRDTGPGISVEEQEQVFDRFFRGKLAESRHIPGTGLGLSMVEEILSAHGGRVTLASKEGEGSTFTLWLRGIPAEASE